MEPHILYEDNDLIVCEKPAGIATQSSRIGSPDMVSILKNYLRRCMPGQPPYLAVIHRLDQPVTGLLVFAKNKKAAAGLTRQLTSSGFGKHYLALLSRIPDNAEGDLTDYLLKDNRTNTSHVCAPDTPGAKEARLHYRILETGEASALAEITLDTGRHHQIRVQMAHLGCPLIGDTKYGGPAASQLQLSAYRLTFRHPSTNKHMEFTLPVTMHIE